MGKPTEVSNDDQRLYRTSTTVATMRTYDDTFSGQKIYPGKGKLFVRSDSKIFRFQNGKSESLFLQRNAEKAKSAAKGAAGQATGRVVGKQASKGAAPKPKPTT